MYVAAGCIREVLSAFRNSKQPDTAAMFLLACHEIYSDIITSRSPKTSEEETLSPTRLDEKHKQTILLPHINHVHADDIATVSDYFGEYQRRLVHLCMDAAPYFD